MLTDEERRGETERDKEGEGESTDRKLVEFKGRFPSIHSLFIWKQNNLNK